MVEVFLTPEAQAQLDRLPKAIRARVYTLIERLGRWPQVSGAKPLRGELAGKFRLRTGDYRLQLRVEGTKVIVERIGHRGGFYER
jgi:mRNA-degrading endonuclease RelE of RelBE toxin-antitoxin system